MSAKPTVIVICGPTAVGKTAAAIKLAQQLKTDIISADSRQCFQELNIGVAKPSPNELSLVNHFFINSHSIFEEVNAAVFTDYALKAAGEILQTKDTAIMVGGTGLYIKAFCEGLDEIPKVDETVRIEIAQAYEEQGINYLQQELEQKDPEFWAIAEQQNPQRLMRALEVLLSTGKSITTFRKGIKEERAFNIIKVGLQINRENLYARINARVDTMITDGLVEEVEQLLAFKKINALQTVGYREIFAYFEGQLSLDKAVEAIKANTRQYAKRQLTWFKKDPQIHWFNSSTFSSTDLATTPL
ncbi:MAG: tRNA dimethylallyltransferase [Segetibacter sp.]|nr:tRNA dimethylallyltransferase [Segetibacter sp.]